MGHWSSGGGGDAWVAHDIDINLLLDDTRGSKSIEWNVKISEEDLFIEHIIDISVYTQRVRGGESIETHTQGDTRIFVCDSY